MLKHLGIGLVLFVGFAIFITLHDDKQTAENAGQEAPHPYEHASTGIARQKESYGDINKAQRHPPSWHSIFAWPNGVTAWGLLFTLWFIAVQADETAKAATATKTAAEATSKSVELMGQQVALQRAERRGVLEVSTEEIEVSDAFCGRNEWTLSGIIRLSNSGAFPLKITGGRGGFIFDRSDARDTVGDFSEVNCKNVWIRPKSRGHIEVFISPEITDIMSEFWEKMSIDPIEFRLEGTIFYNSLGLNWRRNFAYRWAADYTKALSVKNGFWEENPHGQNDEDQLKDDYPVPF